MSRVTRATTRYQEAVEKSDPMRQVMGEISNNRGSVSGQDFTLNKSSTKFSQSEIHEHKSPNENLAQHHRMASGSKAKISGERDTKLEDENSVPSTNPSQHSSQSEPHRISLAAPRTDRRRSRIEDSVTALDALEDAIEQVGESIPTPERRLAPKKPAPAARQPENKRLSIHRKPFVPTKSSKPVTKSTFELPGEAYTRRLKEQRESRKQGDPVVPENPPSHSVEVRLNTAVRNRLSLAKQSMGPEPLNKRFSTADFRRASIQPARRTSIQLQSNPVSRRQSSVGSTASYSKIPPRPAASVGTPTIGTGGRFPVDPQQERRTREENARKARAEAAERGRLASREWAARHKAKALK